MSIAVKIFGGSQIPSITEVEQLEFCFCGKDCYDSYYEYAFVSDSGDSWKSDKSSFLFRKLVDTDSINLEIWKGGVKMSDVVDSTYGTYYPSFTSQPLYVGLVVDWLLVRNAFGNGRYKIKAQKNVLGQSSTFESREFFVLDYNERLANNTVRLETFTTGNILQSEFNYQDLIEGGWYQSIRLFGRFGNRTPVLEIDKELNTSRNVVSVNDSIIKEYTLFTEYLPESVSNQLINDQLLNNRAIINDYNLFNDITVRDLEVYLFDIPSTNPVKRGVSYEFTFRDKIDNLVLRNY